MSNHLHIAVMRGGKVVDDRYVASSGLLSVGQLAKNMVQLGGKDVPPEHLLFSFKQPQPTLNVFAGMRGEIALDGRNRQPLAALQGQGQAAPGGWSLPLPPTARGWVAVGDASFQFHLGPKPAAAPLRPLPPEMKGSLLQNVEATFIGILAAVLAAEIAAMAVVANDPRQVDFDKADEEAEARVAELLMPEKPKEEPKNEDDAKKKAEEEAAKKAAEAAKEEKKEEKKEEEAKKPDPSDDSPAAAKAETERKAQLRENVKNTAMLRVLGSVGGAGGALGSIFSSSTSFGAGIDEALAGAKGGIGVATGSADASARKGSASGDGPATIGGDIGAAAGGGGGGGGAGVALAEKKKVVAPQIAFEEGDMDVEGGEVDKASITSFIRMRIGSVKQCYEKELKLNPSLKGKIVVRFMIMPTGRVSEVGIDSTTMKNADVEACIVSRVKAWSFPVKPEEPAPVTFPFVFSPGG
jgi:outer membrane biosynthesis protein TonB